jgi:hypothetical protein
MGVNVESMFLMFATDNGLKDLLLYLVVVKIIIHRVRDQRSRWE